MKTFSEQNKPKFIAERRLITEIFITSMFCVFIQIVFKLWKSTICIIIPTSCPMNQYKYLTTDSWVTATSQQLLGMSRRKSAEAVNSEQVQSPDPSPITHNITVIRTATTVCPVASSFHLIKLSPNHTRTVVVIRLVIRII